MSINEYNDPKNSLVLFGLGDKLDFLIKLYNSKKLPKVLMITGKKGVGKFTLINHFLNYIYLVLHFSNQQFFYQTDKKKHWTHQKIKIRVARITQG